MKKRNVSLLLALALTAGLTGCGPAGADGDKPWPSREMTVDVAYTAGGTADTANRQLAKLMGETLGTNIAVVNVTGGSGSIAGQQVNNAAHDGYTWLGDVAHTVSGWRCLGYADLGWEDFYGFYAATSPYVLFVAGNSPYETYADLFEAIRADPQMKWGNAGLGSINQLTGQLMLDTLGLTGNSVPYDGGRAAAVKVVAGEVAWSWCGASDILDLAQSGDIRILGVCDGQSLKVESAKGGYEAPSLLEEFPELSSLQDLLYWGFRVPRDTPAEAVTALEGAFRTAVESQEWKDFCASKSLTPAYVVGEESDEMCARLESIYTWGLYDLGMTAEGKSPESFEIPRIEDFVFPANERAENAAPWPQ